ncbi:unnamed protein product [Parascedosporium putredinis]|uniref:Uncharacterized protein n=1 Tax=Parascedosporium putredinis TaxID=1442378 RepID=A0A9P1H0S9_9PEZI|nr:unnamed protein product [Parascedosporium putredinis]CAI7992137.1 unnamed protein product [Parascedosporium putredinis]
MRRGRRDGDVGLPRLTDRADDTPTPGPSSRVPRLSAGPPEETVPTAAPPLAADDHEHESEDDFLLELAARRAERQLHEAALAAFPSNRAREGAANHFYSRESDSETTASESRFSAQPSYTRRRVRGRGAGLRRRSTDLGWWHKVMQEHAEQKDVESEPESIDWYREKEELQCAPASVPVPTEDKPHADIQIVAPKPRKLHKEQGGIARAICAEPQEDESVDMEFEIMRRAASPPLLGDNIVFPRCHSPEPCRLSTDLPYTLRAFEEGRRDLTQKSGLWGGYCYNSAEEQQRAAVEGAMSITCASVLESQPHALALESVTDSCSYLSIVQRERLQLPLLSYPASARAFDEELSGTTGLGLGLDDMRRDDAAILAKGLIWDDEVEKLPEPGRCARWRALKAYVHNWARAQDDLDELSPGVRGRPRPEGSLMA